MTEKELLYVCEATKRFREEAGIEQIEDAYTYFKELDQNEHIHTIVEIGKGFISCVITPSFLIPTKLQCSELAWFVEQEYRGGTTAIKLINKYEQLAKDNKADLITMVCLECLMPNKTASIYEKLGYSRFEQHFIKEL